MNIKKVIRKRVIEKLPNNLQLLIERYYLSYFVKNYIEDEINIIKLFCDSSKNSLDIGANHGVLTMFLSKYSSHVYCYEPVPWLASYLKEKFNKCNVSVEECALGMQNDELYLNIPFIGNNRMETRSSLATDFHEATILGQRVSSVEKVKVKVKKLDDFRFDNIGFVKIDVEGFELQVLEGAKETIQKYMPNMLIEIEQRYHKNKCIYDIFNYIKSLGYKGYYALGQSLMDIEDFDVQTLQCESDEKGITYINNFLFTKSSIDNRQL